jgi:DNA (cytosine-5)-methyltransferase 1
MLDLFSGIGGFSLAATVVWDNKLEIVSFVENDVFCQKVLNKHWPNVPIHDDIKTFKGDCYFETIDLLTGGFPCQPFSIAGKRGGREDDRYLWPEMLRVISEVRPTWVLAENVAGIVNLALDQVCSDLEGEGYEVQSFIIPACAVNAPHRRDRVWIVGYCNQEGLEGLGKYRESPSQRIVRETDSYAADLQGTGFLRKKQLENDSSSRKRRSADDSFKEVKMQGWSKDWLEVATRLCRVDDGLPRGMDRTNRLKALGNSVVPQVIIPIMMIIQKELDERLFLKERNCGPDR